MKHVCKQLYEKIKHSINKSRFRQNLFNLTVFTFIFGIIGATIIIFTRAATPTASFEAESASRSGNSSLVTDANASGGAALQFNAPTPPPPSGTPARQLGVYKSGFPASGNGAFTSFEDELLNGSTILLSENFVNNSFSGIASGNGTFTDWKTWLGQSPSRRAVISVGLVPKKGPTGSWSSDKGTDAQVSTALQQGANGDFDAYWTTFANNLSGDLSDSIIRLSWEFNGGWYPFRAGANPEAFKTYWIRVHGIVKAIRPNVKFDWNASGATFNNYLRNGTGSNVGPLINAYPGDAYVDIIGVDMYDNRERQEGVSYYNKVDGWSQRTGPALQWWMDFADARDKPLSIPEWGTWDSKVNAVEPDNDYYIQKMHQFINSNNVLYHIYFDATATDGDHKLTGATAFPKAKAMFKSLTWKLTP